MRSGDAKGNRNNRGNGHDSPSLGMGFRVEGACYSADARNHDGTVRCDRCGHDMLLWPDSEWHLFDLMEVQYICPNCAHVERRTMTLEERARERGE